MTFGEAIEALKSGNSIYRAGWDCKEMFLHLRRPDSRCLMTLPYIYIHFYGSRVPWSVSQMDLLAEDWNICEGLRIE